MGRNAVIDLFFACLLFIASMVAAGQALRDTRDMVRGAHGKIYATHK